MILNVISVRRKYSNANNKIIYTTRQRPKSSLAAAMGIDP